MEPQVTTIDEPRWPVQMDTDAGRVFMTVSEAELLMFQLNVAVHELDPNGKVSGATTGATEQPTTVHGVRP